MADQPVTREKLINADIDVDNLGKAMNELGVVNPRYGNSYKTIPQIASEYDENSGTKGFNTLAEFEAVKAAIPAHNVITIGEAGPNQGQNFWDGTTLTKSPYDPLTQAENYVDSFATVKAKEITTEHLDTFEVEGDYFKKYSSGTSAELGYPVNKAGGLIVKNNGLSTSVNRQISQNYKVFDDKSEYFRTKIGNLAWAAWVKIADVKDISTAKAAAISETLVAVNNMPTVKSQDIGDSNLDTFTTEGAYYKPFGGDIPTDFASLSYPEKNAGVLDVATNKQTIANLQIKQTYTVFSNSNTYNRQKIGSDSWTSWELTPRKADIDSAIAATSSILAPVITWQKASSDARVSYDPVSKVVSINGYIIGSYGKLASRRIRLTASITTLLTFTILSEWDVIWLDLNAVPADGNITAENYSSIIKVGSYSSASAVRFTGAANQVALMKYDYLNNRVEAAAGFVDVINPSSSDDGETESSDYFDFDKTDKRLNVYLPTSSGEKIRVGLLHQINAAENTANVGSNSDLWRIYTAHLCDANFNVGTQIVNEGEWECAIYHTNDTQAAGVTKDFVGGYHGDELLTDVYFLVNGVKKDQDFVIAGKSKAKEIALIQKSIIYFQGTTTPLAEHSKVVTFTKDAINVKQLLKVLTEVTVNPFYMCMLPIMRVSDGVQVTDYSSRSDDYFVTVDDNSIGGLLRRYSTVDKPLVVKQWGESTGFSSKTTIHKMTQLIPTNNAFIQLLTSGASYNKLYVSPTNVNAAYTIAANTVLESDVTYQLDKTN